MMSSDIWKSQNGPCKVADPIEGRAFGHWLCHGALNALDISIGTELRQHEDVTEGSFGGHIGNLQNASFWSVEPTTGRKQTCKEVTRSDEILLPREVFVEKDIGKPKCVREDLLYLLDNSRNLTLICEEFFNSAMELEVLHVDGFGPFKGKSVNKSCLKRQVSNEANASNMDRYIRRIFLKAPLSREKSIPCSFGLIRIDLKSMKPEVRKDIVEAKIPFGRILENRKIKRKVILDQLWHVHLPPCFFQDEDDSSVVPTLEPSSEKAAGHICTIGRTIRMICDKTPSVLVLEIINPFAFTVPRRPCHCFNISVVGSQPLADDRGQLLAQLNTSKLAAQTCSCGTSSASRLIPKECSFKSKMRSSEPMWTKSSDYNDVVPSKNLV